MAVSSGLYVKIKIWNDARFNYDKLIQYDVRHSTVDFKMLEGFYDNLNACTLFYFISLVACFD